MLKTIRAASVPVKKYIVRLLASYRIIARSAII